MTIQRQVIVQDSKDALVKSVAARFISTVGRLQELQPTVRVVLTGGSVGIGILAAVKDSGVRDRIDWNSIELWWGDERWVAEGHADRNDQQARDVLLDHVAIPSTKLHPFPAADAGVTLDEAAVSYSAELDEFAPVRADGSRFDITFLGVGPDGHIASLFPNRPEIAMTAQNVLAIRDSPKPPPERLSLSLPVINSSNRVWLALAGADKAPALGLALAGASPNLVPAAGAGGLRRTGFFVDRDAAVDVPRELIVADD
jgi:6-phosphogluconolactonase